MNSSKRLLSIAISLLVLVFAFQNCADHQGMDMGNDPMASQAPIDEESESAATEPVNIDKVCLLNSYFSDLGPSSIYMASGRFIEAYASSTVPHGSTCVAEKRYCQNGQLSGNYPSSICAVLPPVAALPCQFNGATIVSGQSVVAYEGSSVAAGTTCRSQNRVCQNGVLSGSYLFSTCSVQQSANCQFNNATVANGQTVTAYMLVKNDMGVSSCASEQRYCNNGFLTGSYPSSTCSVPVPKNCSFNGFTISHGEFTLAYQSGVVPNGTTCQREQRFCNDGTLGGSYLFSACSVSSGGGGGGRDPGGPIQER